MSDKIEYHTNSRNTYISTFSLTVANVEIINKENKNETNVNVDLIAQAVDHDCHNRDFSCNL